jgi:hypothetical protein
MNDRKQLPMNAHVEREGYCEGCEDTGDGPNLTGPLVVLVVGPIWSNTRIVLCLECLPRLAELATFAMAKYEGEVRRAT